MSREKVIKELKGLEQLRDRALKIWSPDDLVERFFLQQINIFASTFFFAIVDLTEENSSLGRTYTTYFRTRNSPLRFLIEQYLTTLHIATLEKNERLIKAFSFIISGKIYIHRVDLKLQDIASRFKLDQSAIKKKLAENKDNYRNFNVRFPIAHLKRPTSLDDFFKDTNLVDDHRRKTNFELFMNGKINYMTEIQNNPLIPTFFRECLLLQYPLLSLDIHPTHNSLGDFDEFIAASEEEKKKIATGRAQAGISFLTFVGKEMRDLTERLLTKDLKVD